MIDRIRRAELKALRRHVTTPNGHSQLAREKVCGASSMWGQPS